MASNFFNQFPGLHKLPFGAKRAPLPPPSTSGGYRPRKSISEVQRSRLESQMSMSLINRGLLNPTGENNCFLNSAVQVLWHIDVFRRSFREMKGHTCIEKGCIFCALKELFVEFQHGGQSAIPPDVLRKAMAECYEEQHRFQLGLMDDAAECFEKILEQIHYHLTGSDDMDTCSVNYCLSHQKFAMTILERTECVCGATSEPLSFVQFVHYISSSAIVKEAQKYAENANSTHPAPSEHQGQSSDQIPGQSSDPDSLEGQSARPRLYSASQVHFGKILNMASSFGEYRQCSEYPNCKKTVLVKRLLLNCPDVVCLGMIWDSDCPSVDEIMKVVLSIGLTLELNDLFDHVFTDNAQYNQYELTALIAYYGRHYSTFCYHSKLKEWIYFDDAKFRSVGTEWADVCEQIQKAHHQPLLLVYTNPFGDVLDLSKAPKAITKVRHDNKSHDTIPLPVLSEELNTKNSTTSSKSGSATPTNNSPQVKKAELSNSGLLTLDNRSSQGSNSVPGIGGSSYMNQDIGKTSQSEGVVIPNKATHVEPGISPTMIDPMTLSIIPLQHGTRNSVKSTLPITGENQASATPTSSGAVPTSALQLARMNSTGSEDSGNVDLMSFSIPPSILGTLPSGQVPAGTHIGVPTPSGDVGGHQLEHSLVNSDLIEFSLSPMRINMLQSIPKSTQVPGYGISAYRVPAPAVFPVSSKGISNTYPNSNVSSGIHSHSPVAHSHPPVSSGTYSHSPVPPEYHSKTLSTYLQPSQSHSSFHSHTTGTRTETNNIQLHPDWEHFSDDFSKPVGGAPQKLLPTEMGVAKSGNYGNYHNSSEDDKKKLSKADQTHSPAIKQLKRIASQPGFEEVGGALVGGDSKGAEDFNIRELELLTMTLREGDKLVKDTAGYEQRFSPQPLAPDAIKIKESALLYNQGSGKNIPPDVQGVTLKSNPSNPKASSLLEDAELAFPQTDSMFTDLSEKKVLPAEKELNYVELDLKQPSSSSTGKTKQNVGVARIPDSKKDIEVNYAEIRIDKKKFQPSREVGREGVSPATKDESEDYIRLVDVSTRVSGKSQSHDNVIAALSNSSREKLRKAQNLFAQGEASMGSDDTVAMMLFQQFNSLLLEVLQDPLVRATSVLYQQIKAKRDEGIYRCQSLQRSNRSITTSTTSNFPLASKELGNNCKRCGRKRQLDNHMLCGPCQLRERINK